MNQYEKKYLRYTYIQQGDKNTKIFHLRTLFRIK